MSLKKMIIIGWDGATFKVLDQMIAKNIMPNLKTILKRGVRSDLYSTIPPITGPSWTSFRTGKKPENHGLFSFFEPPDNSLDLGEIKRHTSKNIDGISYWNILESYNKKNIIVDLPLTDPVEKLNGIMVSGLMTRGLRGVLTYPDKISETIEKKFPDYFKTSLTDGLDVSSNFLDKLIYSVNQKCELDCYFLENEDWDVFTSVYSAVDTLQHYFWKFMDENSIQFVNNKYIKEKIEVFFRKLDGTLGKYLEFLDKEGDLIIVSDHGFGPNNFTFFVNNFLLNNGYLVSGNKLPAKIVNSEIIKSIALRADVFNFRRLIRKELREKLNRSFESGQRYCWEESRAFFRSNNEYGIYINMKGKYFGGTVEERDYSDLIDEMTEKLMSLKNPFTGEYVLESVSTKEKLYKNGKYRMSAPDIVLIPSKGLNLGGITHFKTNNFVRKNKKLISGFHEKEGIFIGYGEAFAENTIIDKELFIYDIAPLILTVFNLPADVEMDGNINKNILKGLKSGDIPKRKKYRIKKIYNSNEDFNDNESIEQLRGLGYID